MRTSAHRLLGSAAIAVIVAFAITADAGIIINEDNDHFFGDGSPETMTVEGLNAYVDQYADSDVSHLFLCPNAMRANFASKTREAIWDLGDQDPPQTEKGKRWVENTRLLHERGLDPYAIWIARCREKGIVPWLSMRMNDVHDATDLKNYRHSMFWRNHPEFWRVPHAKAGGLTPRALDYAHPEVREHAMSFVRELLERYDPDGLELDWMRFGWHFAPGEEQVGAGILTEFMREARRLTREWSEKRGHPIQLGARVPAHPDAAKGLGMDGVRWAKEGIVDMLVPCPFWTTTDYDIPVELWRERLGDAAEQVVIAPGIEENSRAYRGAEAVSNDLAATRGFAASAWHRGADRIYLFNYIYFFTRRAPEEGYQKLVREGLSPEAVNAAPRRHIQTFHDTVPSGFDNGQALPKEMDEPATFNLHIGPKPTNGNVVIISGLAKRDGLADAAFSARLNGENCESLADRGNPGQYPGVARAIQFGCPLETVTDGYNEIAIEQTAGEMQRVVWVEIRIEP